MSLPNWRINLVLVFIFILGATILGRVFFLGILNHQFYKALAEGQQKILTPTIGERGEIFFRDGTPVVVNKTGKYLFICPKEIKDKEETARILSKILNIDENLILEKANKLNLFELIKQKLSQDEQGLLAQEDLNGAYLEDEIYRYYPQENLCSHITGFVGGSEQGQYGIEGFYDAMLKGKEILSEKERGPSGFLEFSSPAQESQGKNIITTIDKNIQFMAQSLLLDYQEELSFESGQILVMNPSTGEILALSTVPNFDPNYYSLIEDSEIFQNSVIQKIFEPGSVFKPITMAAALNEDKVTPQTTYVDYGKVQIGGWPIFNYDQRTWGTRTMTEVLEKSINTGAVFAEQSIGHQTFLEYLEKFGFFEKTGIDLQGEVFSENLEFKKGYDINFATASFGQGIEITLIQLARSLAVIANGGKLINPYIAAKTPETKQESSTVEESIISKKTASQLTAMMVSVIENGFSKKAKIDGYFIAGKTGTAQVSWGALGIPKSGYSLKTVQTFAGFFPAFDAEFLILVKLDDPQTRTAEYSAMPIFRELAKYIIDYFQIPPDYE